MKLKYWLDTQTLSPLLNIWQAKKEHQKKMYTLVSLTFKDIPSWKLNKLFINNDKTKQKDFTS